MKACVFLATVLLCESARIEYSQLEQELATHAASKESTKHQAELAASTGACYCACTKSYSAVFFKSRSHEVWGTLHGVMGPELKKAHGGIYYYVEVRHIAKGMGNASWSLMRTCDHTYCNNDDAAKHCGDSYGVPQLSSSAERFQWGSDDTSAMNVLKHTRRVSSAMNFLKQNAPTLVEEARAKMKVTSQAYPGWSYIRDGKDSGGVPVIPSILNTNDPNIVVAVYWTTEYGSKDIYKALSGWNSRFEPKDSNLAWGFEEILGDVDKFRVPVTPQITGQTALVPKGMLVGEVHEEYEDLPSK